MDVSSKDKIYDGCRILVVGGGPAASFFALHLIKLSNRYDKKVNVTLFDPHSSLSGPGPESCKGCAGVLSNRLINGLDRLGIGIPDEIIQEKLSSLSLQFGSKRLVMGSALSKERSFAVYRGRGPINNPKSHPKSFDQFLRDTVMERGGEVVNDIIQQVDISDDSVELKGSKESYFGDFAVVATGIHDTVPIRIGDYTPPESISMLLTEVVRNKSWPEGESKVFYSADGNYFAFGAAVPKGKYGSVALLSNQESPSVVVHDFIKHELCQDHQDCVYASKSKCVCHSNAAISSAKNYFGDRYSYLGDAVVTRLFKDGIGSAFFSGKSLANSIFYQGFSKKGRMLFYYPYCLLVALDNRLGFVLFRMFAKILRCKIVEDELYHVLLSEQQVHLSRRPYSKFLWRITTGGSSYFSLCVSLLRFKTVMVIWRVITLYLKNKKAA